MVKKIVLEKPENMAVVDIEQELQMRLHDLELRYDAESPNCEYVKFLREAQRLIHVGDNYKAECQTMPIARAQQRHAEAASRENAERIINLFACLNKEDSKKRTSALANIEQFELIESEVVDEFGMSQADLDRLNQLEFAIQKGVDGFRAAGEALTEIRDSGLYKQYGTFEEYCEQKWQFSRSRAYQFIESTKVVDNLLTSGVEPSLLPQNESQTRALSTVPVDKQAEVWNEAKKDGKPSASKIRAAAGDRIPALRAKNSLPPSEGREEEWNANLWETPTNIAKAMAMLLQGGEAILEPCAGSGQIARAIVDIFDVVDWEYELTAIEILKERAAKLADNRYFSIDADFLKFDFGSETFDAVVTNPPFDIGMEILEKALTLIKPSGRCLFLLPIAYFSTKERAKKFADMNAHIHKVYPIVGRVGYLKHGVVNSGRQCEDAVFDIRLGKGDGGVEFIWQ